MGGAGAKCVCACPASGGSPHEQANRTYIMTTTQSTTSQLIAAGVAPSLVLTACCALAAYLQLRLRSPRGEANAESCAAAASCDPVDTTPCEIVLIDADNVRAALAWPPRQAFRHAVAQWSNGQPDLAVILASDGGNLGCTRTP